MAGETFEPDLLWAFERFSDADRLTNYQKYRDYYDGKQDLTFATKKFSNAFGAMFKTFAYNRCGPVIDAIADRLQLTGFDITAVGDAANVGADVSGADTATDPLQAALNVVWEANKMDKKQGDVHQELFKCGDVYIVVWPELQPDGSFIPKLYVNRAGTVAVNLDQETLAKRFAVKAWRIQSGPKKDFWRLTFYYPDRIEKWIGRAKKDNLSKGAGDYEPYRPEMEFGLPEPWPVPNPFLEVPVIWFANNAWEGEYGRSELRDVLPLQDALNKAGMDLLVAMEYGAYRQRWVTGMGFGMPNPVTGKIDSPFREGPGEIWSGPNEAKFGDFAASDLKQFIDVQNQFDGQISNVARIPKHWLNLTMDNPPSGESFKAAEYPFVAKLEDRQISTGNPWEEVYRLALKQLGVTNILKIESLWKNAELRSDTEAATLAKARKDVGVPDEQLWTELGYDDAQIESFKEAKAQAVLEAQAAFSQGAASPFPSTDTGTAGDSGGTSNQGE